MTITGLKGRLAPLLLRYVRPKSGQSRPSRPVIVVNLKLLPKRLHLARFAKQNASFREICRNFAEANAGRRKAIYGFFVTGAAVTVGGTAATVPTFLTFVYTDALQFNSPASCIKS